MRRDLARLTGREHDLLVIGGGIHGAAAAWDGAQRGLRVALVEAADFGAATSWNSLKTVHGGLRHLQRADLAAMRESVRERRALLRIAPALVRPLPFMVPTFGWRQHALLAAGLLANDVLSTDRNQGLATDRTLPRSRMLSPAEVVSALPGMSAAGLTGAASWHDAQVQSTERLLLAFLHAADAAGACLTNHVRVESLTRDGARVAGASVVDAGTGARSGVRARIVLNAAGPGAVALLAAASVPATPRPLVRGLNLVVRRAPGPAAVGIRSRGRYLFTAPWCGVTLVGTAYASVDADPLELATGFLAECRSAFPWLELVASDVALAHQGLVPGTSAHELTGRALLVDHERSGLPGLVTMQGVKYTTARGLAERAVDIVCGRLGRGAIPSRTAVTPIAATAPAPELLAARALRAVRSEMAVHLDDALLRRLDLGTAGPPSDADVTTVAGVMKDELGWSEAEVAAEVDRVRRAEPYRLAATMAAQAGGPWTE